MLEEIEVFTGFPMIHSSHAGVSFRPAGHGASHRVKGIGGTGPFETEHIGSQKKLVTLNGGLLFGVSPFLMAKGNDGSAFFCSLKVFQDGGQIIGANKGVGIQRNKQGRGALKS